ncbi:hypothetical protein [Acinetobacter ursingii]|uniref:hypothetical protein n=1 Tax=Acinetobacter ursingii TaxID=108980 RepID=UPI001C099ECA|nr:hypothetical protein [Acinetobacter ursingii]MCU4483646.1 hypothetical protein [Acinetobacter ursingii]MCU4507966.1 hypothetical protein [Acinetobacter ursingii]
MNNINYLSPILCSISNTRIILQGRILGRAVWIMGICPNVLPMLDWDYSHTSICFNPKKIPKVPNRKQRKACYQAFALYKKSFKPTPQPKLKLWRDELPAIFNNSFRAYSDHMSDAFAYFAHVYKERAKLAALYESRWDLNK